MSIIDPIELSLRRLQHGIGWLTTSLWGWATARPDQERTDRVIDHMAKGQAGSAAAATRNREYTAESARRHRVWAWSIIAAWLVALIGGSLWWTHSHGGDIFIRAVVHVSCTGLLVWLISLEVTGREADILLTFVTLVGNAGYAAMEHPEAAAVAVGAPFAAAVAVAWVHGPTHVSEPAVPVPVGDSVGSVNGPQIAVGLRHAVPAIDALYKAEEAAAAKGGERRAVIPAITLVAGEDGRVIAPDILLPGKATVADVQKELPRLAAQIGANPEAVFASPVDGRPNRLRLVVLPCLPHELPPLPWAHTADDPAPKPGFVSIGHDEADRAVWVPYADENTLIAGQKGSGKSTAMRAYATAVLMQPWTRVHIFNFKGNADFLPFETVAAHYRAGSEDADVVALVECLEWVIAQARERNRLIQDMTRADLNAFPNQTFTAEHLESLNTAEGVLDGYELDGVWVDKIIVDEVNIATGHPVHGPRVNELLTEIGEKYRSVCVTYLLGVQRPSKEAVSTAVKAQAGAACCLAVASSGDRDLVLGDRWSGPQPQTFRDAEGFPLSGLAAAKGMSSELCRVSNVTLAAAAPLIAAAAARRGSAQPPVDSRRPPVRGVLGDVLAGWPRDVPFRRSADVADAVSALRGAEVSASALAAEMRAVGVGPARGAAADGARARGYHRATLVAAAGHDPDPSHGPSTTRPQPSTGHPPDTPGTATGTPETPHNEPTNNAMDSPDSQTPHTTKPPVHGGVHVAGGLAVRTVPRRGTES